MSSMAVCLWLVAVVAVNAQYQGPSREQQQYQSQQQYRQYQQQPAVQDQYEPRRPLPAIIMHKQALSTDGAFNYAFAADNGLQQGETINPDGSRTGSYSYVDPSGKTIKVKYSAGKDGFRVLEGDHLPKAPQPIAPVPGPAQGAEPAGFSGPQSPSVRYSAQAQFRQGPSPAGPFRFNDAYETSNQGTTAIFGGQQSTNPYQVREDYEPALFRSSAPSLPRYQQSRPTAVQQSNDEQPERQEPHSFGGGYSFEFAG